MTDQTPAEPQAHVHEWQANGTVQVDVASHSPVSVMDDTVRTVTYAVQSCSCGAAQKVAVAASPSRWLNRRNA